MTPQERDVLLPLLERLRQTRAANKDAEAEQLIRQTVQTQPDAPYILAQTVLMQDYALHAAQDRIHALEQQLAQRQQQSQQEAQHSSGGGFLSGLLGGNRQAHAPAPPPPPPPSTASVRPAVLWAAALRPGRAGVRAAELRRADRKRGTAGRWRVVVPPQRRPDGGGGRRRGAALPGTGKPPWWPRWRWHVGRRERVDGWRRERIARRRRRRGRTGAGEPLRRQRGDE